jgi:hypothetical protein
MAAFGFMASMVPIVTTSSAVSIHPKLTREIWAPVLILNVYFKLQRKHTPLYGV